MSDIFTEVDEGIRQEKLEGLWKKWRPFVYGGVAALIIGVAVNEFVLKPQAEARREARALALETGIRALEDADYAGAEEAFTRIMNDDPRLAPLAAHFLAQTKFEGGGDAAAAAELLASVGGIEGGPYERLALLKSAYFKADTMTLEELELTLGSLADDESTLGALSRELIGAKAFEAGDLARARTIYNRLRFDAYAPQGLVQRADIALAAIPVPPETEEATEAAPAEAAPAEPQETGQ
ncbi:tetratricopeptide repeat protein [Hyphomonas sp.]|uniref:tetratricopeptide repeat protein n=1 Tax=Hyphomonas sp. TaxID=87 RepID=UPI001BD18AD0|nr:tetratricopeptide repeat protein [Hyphomonas sp.]